MTGDLDEEIEREATRLRSALDRIDRAHWEAHNIREFPRGSCGHCAEMVGRFLREQLGIEAIYVSANFRMVHRNQGHAWVEYDGLVIDISADQFGLPPVIVSRFSSFHTQGFDRQSMPLNRDGGWWSSYCYRVWNAAMDLLSER
jgi:hypothetical protein